jgi:uncharacterized protein (TIGR03382 family)
VIEGKKLENADALSGSTGDGSYSLNIIVPTYSPRHNANGISELATTGTYGQGAVTPIPDPFDNNWLIQNGYEPFVLGAYSAEGEVDSAPVMHPAAQRTGPTRFGGDVSSTSVPITFELADETDRVEVLFAVRLAPPDLEEISPVGQAFPGTNAGAARGAADFFPGPGPIFVGYDVGKPTGIATVPIRVDRHHCEDDDECVPGQFCLGVPGVCEDPCVDDSTCPSDEVCEDGTCEPPPPPCVEQEDCTGDLTCIGGFCVPECPTDCADPEFCDRDACIPPDGTPPCVVETQCDPSEVCEDGVCQPPLPPCDVSCPEGTVCDGGFCEPPEQPCTEPGDCPGGDICVEGVCNPGQPPCLPGDCPTCTYEGDCPGGDTCLEGVCVPTQPPVPCLDDLECPTDQSCEGGFCTPPPEPCGPGGICRPGELCETGPNVCVPEHPPVPCTGTSDCPSGDECTGGFCEPPPRDPCQNNNQCGADDVCNNGWCEPPCNDTSECAGGSVCQGGFCTPPDPCENQNQCGGDDVCNYGACEPPPVPCTEDTECSSGYCDGGFCQPPHTPIPCTNAASDCPSGDLCVSGYCEPPQGCTNDTDCPGGELCYEDGTCQPGQPPVPCELDNECPPTNDDVWVPVCYGGFCQPSPGSCNADEDCPGGFGCIEGICLPVDPPNTCVTVFDCAGNETCVSGVCTPGGDPNQCETADDCPINPNDDVGPACVGGMCTSASYAPTTCGSINDCSPGFGCELSLCVPVVGACQLDGDCGGEGQECVGGWCGSSCSTSADCGNGDVCAFGRCATSCSVFSECGDYEACLGGGCVPVVAAVNNLNGDQSLWDVDMPNNGELKGGCNAAGETSGGSFLFLLGLAFVLRRRKNMGSAQ